MGSSPTSGTNFWGVDHLGSKPKARAPVAPVNLEFIREKATDIRSALARLRHYASLGKDAFLEDETSISAAKYQLVVAIEAAHALCNHLAKGSGRPRDSAMTGRGTPPVPATISGRGRASTKRALRDGLARRPEVVFAYLFGSFAERLPFRDIDIAVWIHQDTAGSLEPDPWRYEAKLEAALTASVDIPVDVTVLNYAPLALRYHATRGEVLFSRDETQRCTFLEGTWRDYFEMQPYFRQFLRDILEA